MKRRVFLSATGTVGIAGVASGGSVISSVYSSLSESVSLAEFSSSTKTILDSFVSELALNIQELGLEKEHIASVAMPLRIINKDEDNNRIVYKNKAGNYVDLSMKNGLKIIRITNTL